MFEQTFKNIDDILYKDAGADSELDYIGQTSWILFLRYLDDDDIEKFNIDNIKQGYCIRTKSPINYNIKYPIKYEEYKTSDDKSGKYCHECGSDAITSVNQPLCDECG